MLPVVLPASLAIFRKNPIRKLSPFCANNPENRPVTDTSNQSGRAVKGIFARPVKTIQGSKIKASVAAVGGKVIQYYSRLYIVFYLAQSARFLTRYPFHH
jgi:hypothetical protein